MHIIYVVLLRATNDRISSEMRVVAIKNCQESQPIKSMPPFICYEE